MRICVVGFSHPKNDKRVIRTVKALAEQHHVEYIYWTENKKEKPISEANINYVPMYYKHGHKISERREFELFVANYLRCVDCDLAYFHHYQVTVPFKPYKAFTSRGIPVITDIHEYIPDDYLASISRIPKKLRVAAGKHIFKGICKLSSALVMTRELTKEKAERYNTNTFLFENLGNRLISPLSKEKRNKEIVLVGATPRNFDREKQLFKRLDKSGFDIVMIGSKKKPEQDFIKYEPFIENSKLLDRISRAAFSFCSFDPRDNKGNIRTNYLYSSANKLYDSICAGTPVIVEDDFVEMKRHLADDGVGVLISPSNSIIPAMQIKEYWKYGNYQSLLTSIKDSQYKYVFSEARKATFLDFVRGVKA